MVLSDFEIARACQRVVNVFWKGLFYKMGSGLPFLFHHRRHLSYPRLFVFCNLLRFCLFFGTIAANLFLVTRLFYIFTFNIFLCSSLLLRSLYYSFLFFHFFRWLVFGLPLFYLLHSRIQFWFPKPTLVFAIILLVTSLWCLSVGRNRVVSSTDHLSF